MEYKWLKGSKYRKITVKERLEILDELNLSVPDVLQHLVANLDDAAERIKGRERDPHFTDQFGKAVPTWEAVSKALKEIVKAHYSKVYAYDFCGNCREPYPCKCDSPIHCCGTCANPLSECKCAERWN